jgi:hypothetical protein
MIAMNDQDDDAIDDSSDDTEDFTPAIVDPLEVVIQLCKIAANPKAAEAVLKKIRRAERAAIIAEQKSAIASAKSEQKLAELAQLVAALDARAAALDEQARALDAREAAFESQATAVRDELREQHARLEQTHRQLVHRIMSVAGITANWNPNLQSPPSWAQLRQMIADLPEDLPAPAAEPTMPIDAFADVCSDPGADRHGNVFLGTLSRGVSHKGAQ